MRKRVRRLPAREWAVLILDHHPGYIDWVDLSRPIAPAYAGNTQAKSRTRAGSALREGSALVQGIATCGHCGRRLRTHYRGTGASPGYHCAGKEHRQWPCCLLLEHRRRADRPGHHAVRSSTAVHPGGQSPLPVAGSRRALTPRDDVLSRLSGAAMSSAIASAVRQAERRYRAVHPGEPARRPQPRGGVGAGC